ncbi:MAG: TonB-dependent receptor domain-containing protein [Bryobacteraceae bacterium]
MVFAARLAAEAPAALEGVVAAGETPLPGARVVVAGAAGRFETASDEAGRYRFAALPPGTHYAVSALREGFRPAEVPRLALAAGERRVLDIQMQLETLRQSLTVAAEAAPAAVERARAVTAAELSALPSNGRSFTRFALLDPRVRQTQGLASDGAAGARLSINAQSFRHTGHMIDGISNYDVVFANAPRQSFPLASIEEVRVIANPYSAEYGGSAAGAVAATTRAGTDLLHGEAFGFLRPSGAQAKPPLSTIHVPNQRAQHGAALAGPVFPGRTTFFASFERTAQDRGSFIQSPAPLAFTGNVREWFALARADHRFGRRQSLALRLNGHHARNNNVNDRIGGFTQPSAAQESYTQAAGAQATHRMAFAAAVNELRAAYSAYTPSAARTLHPAVSIVRPSYSVEGGSAVSWVHARAAQLSEQLGWRHGGHQISAGGEVQRQAVKDYSFTPFGEYRFAAGPPAPGQQPLQYTQTFGQSMLRYGQSQRAAFVNDHWGIAPRLSASLGLRYESQSLTGSRANLAPRAGLSWDIAGDGKTVVRGGAGVFYDQYYFYITRRFYLQGLHSPAATYTIPFGAPGFPAFPASLSEAPAGISGGKRDLYLAAPRLLNPYSLQYSLGVRRELGGRWTLSADAQHQHTLRQMRAADTNAPAPFPRTAAAASRTVAQADATRPFQTWAGVPVRNALVIENSGSSIYDALDIALAKRFAETWNLQSRLIYSSSVAYSMFFGEPNTGIPNEWSDTGRAERGPSDFHQRCRWVTTSSFGLPGGFQLALGGSVGSGLPVNPVTGTDNNGDTFTADRPVGMGRNSFRGPLHASLDAAGSRSFRLSEALRLELRAEAFNALNRNNYGRVNGTYGNGAAPGPLFLTPMAGLQNSDPSRQLQVALKLAW